MTHEIVFAFAVLGSLANVVWAWPQAVLMLRTGVPADVSAGTWTLVVCDGVMLMKSAVTVHYWTLLASAASMVVAAVLVLAGGTRAVWPRRWLWVVGAGALVAFVCPPGLGDVSLLLLLGALVPVPQIVRMIRSPSAAGVSVSTWAVYTGQAVIWMVPLAVMGNSLRGDVLDLAVGAALLAVLVSRRLPNQPGIDSAAARPNAREGFEPLTR